jgi:hypothetical protein
LDSTVDSDRHRNRYRLRHCRSLDRGRPSRIAAGFRNSTGLSQQLRRSARLSYLVAILPFFKLPFRDAADS